MKRIIGLLMLVALFITSFGYVFAANKSEAISEYAAELVSIGMEEDMANTKAASDVKALVDSMKGGQSSVDYGFNTLEERVENLLKNDLRRDQAVNALESAEKKKNTFLGLNAENEIFVQESIGGAPPRVMAGDNFSLAREDAEDSQSRINRILIAPTRPGSVPTGDIVSDFIPQIIRQLFRFTWVAVLFAFTASGIMLIVAHGNDERLTKAKSILYFTLIGFAFVTLAFAITKAVTDIDFFRFI